MNGRVEVLDIISRTTNATQICFYVKYKDDNGKYTQHMVRIDRDDLADYGVESSKGEFWITPFGVYLQKFIQE